MACDFGDAGPPQGKNACGGITWQGCCDGQGVRYCVAGELRWKDCNKAPLCGWKTAGAHSFYDCGTGGKADPSGKLPKKCQVDAGVRDASPACGPVTRQGCCVGDRLYYCAAGNLKSMDCSKSPSCGWQAAADYYDCSTDGEADPTGQHPRACAFDGGPPPVDAGPTAVDRSIHDTRETTGQGASGCGCDVAARSPGGAGLLLLLLVAAAGRPAAMRRRRRR
jgi:hypothetical protein